MKKKIFGGIAVMAVMTMVAVNIKLHVNNKNELSSLTLSTIETLAYGEVTQCDILKYNRNEKEQYVTTTVMYSLGLGLHTIVNGRTVTLGGGVSVGGSIGIPDCVPSTGNCCEKSFIEKTPKYY